MSNIILKIEIEYCIEIEFNSGEEEVGVIL